MSDSSRFANITSIGAFLISIASFIFSAFVYWDQKAEKRTEKLAAEKSEAQAKVLMLSAELVSQHCIKVRVPEGFNVSHGRMHLPYAPVSAQDITITNAPTSLDLEAKLRHFESALTELVRSHVEAHGSTKVDHCTLKLPMVSQMTYTIKGENLTNSDVYHLFCKAEWNRDGRPPDVKITITGMGYGYRPGKPTDSLSMANDRWEKRLEEFKSRL